MIFRLGRLLHGGTKGPGKRTKPMALLLDYRVSAITILVYSSFVSIVGTHMLREQLSLGSYLFVNVDLL